MAVRIAFNAVIALPGIGGDGAGGRDVVEDDVPIPDAQDERGTDCMAWEFGTLTSSRNIISVGEGDYAFCNLDGSRIRSFKMSWEKACKLAGLEDFHFHDLRHTYCSNIRMRGRDEIYARFIGHRDISMTDRYTHIPTDTMPIDEAGSPCRTLLG